MNRADPALHRQAFDALRALPGWPPTLEDAMRRSLSACLIRLASIGIRRGSWADTAAPQPKRAPQLGPLPALDLKRAAAGDIGDDD